MATEITTSTSHYALRSDGIVVQRIVEGTTRQTLVDAKANVAAFQQVAAGKMRPLLVDMRQNLSTEKGVREYYAGPESAKYCLAMAMLVGAPSSRIVGNFFLSISRPPFPCRLFSDDREASAWLLGFMRGA
jgi:hypothetical protein